MKIGDIITKYCSDHGLSYRQFALQCGVTNGYISMLINGENPKTGKPLRPTVETYEKLAVGMGMDINELFNMMDDAPVSLAMPSGLPIPSNVRPISALHRQRIPLIGSVAAGEPIYDPEELGVYVDAPVDADAAITIRGDSMIPTYQDGDVVYIKCRPDVPEGAVAVVFLDDEAALKHVYKRPTGLTLISDNPDYPPIMAEFEDYPNMRIFGVPVGYTRIFKADPLRRIKKGF